jgi:hypothetical protein
VSWQADMTLHISLPCLINHSSLLPTELFQYIFLRKESIIF